MKNSVLRTLFGLIIIVSISPQAKAQGIGGYFSPNSVTFIDSIGAKTLEFTTTFYGFAYDTSVYVNFVGYPGLSYPGGITSDPPGCYLYYQATQVAVKVFVNLDSVPTCMEAPEGLCAYVGNTALGVAGFFTEGYTYDAEKVGRMYILSGDSLDFGNVPLGTDDSLFVYVHIDTDGSIFAHCQH